jgi:hypothetical protein
MSITAEERSKIPEEDFAGPNRSFPCDTAEHCRAAWDLAGHAENKEEVQARIKSIAKRKGFPLPSTAEPKDVGMADDEMVEEKARIFRFGHYPAKDWIASKDKFIAANGTSGTIPIGLDPINLKHYEGKRSILDGRTGNATFSVEGDEVHATTRMPKWLAEARKEAGLKISAVIGRVSSVLRKIDLTDNPHIKDAVFFDDGEAAVVVFDDDDVEFADEGKAHMAQMQHDVIAGMCEDAGLHLCGQEGDQPVDKSRKTLPNRGNPAPQEFKLARALRVAHDHCIHEGGAYCPGMDQQHEGSVGMTSEDQEIEPEEEEPIEMADETPREKALRLKVERLEAERVADKAIEFANSVTKGNGRRAYPAERQAILEGYQRAAAVDAKLCENVTFSDGDQKKTGSYLDAFKASIKMRPVIATRPENTVEFGDHDLDSEPKSDRAKEEADWDAEVKAGAKAIYGKS